MIKCRAKMIDGSPVTFEHHDLGEWQIDDKARDVPRAHKVWAVKIVGEGFHVLSISWSSDFSARTDKLRCDLDRAGVDTATAEMWDKDIWNQTSSYWEGTTQRCRGTLGGWLPLFPPTVREMPSSVAAGSFRYMTDSGPEPNVEMLHNGSAALHDAIMLQSAIYKGQFQFRDPLGVVRDIWKRMEKGRRQ